MKEKSGVAGFVRTSNGERWRISQSLRMERKRGLSYARSRSPITSSWPSFSRDYYSNTPFFNRVSLTLPRRDRQLTEMIQSHALPSIRSNGSLSLSSTRLSSLPIPPCPSSPPSYRSPLTITAPKYEILTKLPFRQIPIRVAQGKLPRSPDWSTRLRLC